jgi:prepilin-type N-terminal cleavage/methylation domain-containing protein
MTFPRNFDFRSGSSARSRRSGGFTLVEILIVIAVFSVLVALVAPVMPKSLTTNDLESSAASATDALRQAQGNVLTGREYRRWGVHFQADRFVLFGGAAYDSGAADNVVTVLSGQVRISAVALGGTCDVARGAGDCDVHYAQIEGVPTEAGTVTFTDAYGGTKTVTVGIAGMTSFE